MAGKPSAGATRLATGVVLALHSTPTKEGRATTQREIAKTLGISTKTVGKILRGETAGPSTTRSIANKWSDLKTGTGTRFEGAKSTAKQFAKPGIFADRLDFARTLRDPKTTAAERKNFARPQKPNLDAIPQGGGTYRFRTRLAQLGYVATEQASAAIQAVLTAAGKRG